MALWHCACPFGCDTSAEDGEICASCRLGWHRRQCEQFQAPSPGQMPGCCGRCGLKLDLHPEGIARERERYRNVAHLFQAPPPHGEMGVKFPLPLEHYDPDQAAKRHYAQTVLRII